MATSNTKPRAWVTAAAGALAFAGGDKMGAQAFADEPPAKTTTAPDAKLNAMIATLEAGFGHRTSGSKEARDYVAGVENVKKRNSLHKQLTETVPALIADMQDNTRRIGARKKLDQEIESLIADLGDDDFNTRLAATMVLNDFSHYAMGALVQTAEKNEDPEVKYRARLVIDMNRRVSQADAKKLMSDVKTLASLNPPPEKSIPVIMEAFWKRPVDDSRGIDYELDFQHKKELIGMLANLKAGSQLTDILRDDAAIYVRDLALEAIGKMGADAWGAVPVVKEMFAKDRKYPLGITLAKIRADEKNLPDLMKEAKAADAWDRWSAVLALSEIAPKIKLMDKDTRRELLQQFIDGLEKDNDFDVRREAAVGIGNLSRNAVAKEERAMIKEKAVPALMVGLRYYNDSVKAASATSLRAIGADAEAALPLLKELKETANSLAVSNACEEAVTAIEAALRKDRGR